MQRFSCRTNIMEVLEREGLRPKIKSRNSYGAVIEVSIGGKREVWLLGMMPKVLRGRV